LSGINALIDYTAHIFRMAGYGSMDALLQSVIIGFTNLVFTMAAMTIIDRFGRKNLILVGSIGYILSLSATAYSLTNSRISQMHNLNGRSFDFQEDSIGVIIMIALLSCRLCPAPATGDAVMCTPRRTMT